MSTATVTTAPADALAADRGPVAAALAAAGVPVFPWSVRGGRKVPLTRNGHNDATTDAATVARWWQRHPAAQVGAVWGGTGIVPLDLDRHPGKPNGFDTVDVLGLDLPDTLTLATPSGGEHRYYRHDGPDLARGIGVRPGIDRLSGSTGWGGFYGSTDDVARLAARDLPDLPAWAAEGSPERASVADDGTDDDGGTPAQRAALAAFWQRCDEPDEPYAPAGPFARLVTEAATAGNDGMARLVWTWTYHAARGARGARTALRAIRAAWLDREHSTGDPRAEFTHMVRSAVARNGDQPPALDVAAALADDEAPVPADEREALWTARPFLAALAAFALARNVGRWSMLGAVLARAAAAVPPSVVLPAVIGSPASLNLFVALCGGSGGGKTATTAAAGEFLTPVGGVPFAERGPGSGEGLLSAYVHTERDGTMVQHGRSVLLVADEAQSLGALAGRTGSTLTGFLKSAWSGAPLGTLNAETIRNRQVDRHTYRLAMVTGLQPAHADVLLDDEGGGFPQRWVWLPTYDAALDTAATSGTDPQPWPWTVPSLLTLDANGDPVAPARVVLPIPGEARAAILAAYRARNRPIGAAPAGDVLDGHALQVRERVAALLALLDGRLDVDGEDWRLAGVVLRVSDETRAQVVAVQHAEAERANVARGRAEGQRAAVAAEAVDAASVQRAARWALGRLRRESEGMPSAALRKAAPGRLTSYLSDALAALVAAGQVSATEGEYHGQPRTLYRAEAD